MPKKITDKFKKVSVYFYLFAFTGVIAFGLYNILRLGPSYHMIAIRNMDYVYPFSHIFSSPLDPLKPFLIRSLQYFWVMGPWPLVFLVFTSLIVGLRYKRTETLVIFLTAVVPVFVVSEFQKVLTARYIFFTLPYFCILAGMSSEGYLRWGKSGRKVYWGIILLPFFMISALKNDFLLLIDPQKAPLPNSERTGYLEGWTSGFGIYEVSRTLSQNYSGGQGKVYVGTEGYFGTLPDGLEIYMRRYPNFEVFGTGVDFSEVPVELREHAAKGDKTFFVVNSSRLHRDYKELPLKLIAAYPKAEKADGTRDQLYFFEVQNVR